MYCELQLSPDIEKLVRGVVSESKTDVAKDDFEVNNTISVRDYQIFIISMMYVLV